MPPLVSDVRITVAPQSMQATGLYAWARVLVDGRWEVDGLAVRRTQSGAFVVTFPTRTDGAGHARAYFRPIDKESRTAIENAVLRAARDWRPRR
jgi:DNA-binding cell septation regulator SpoVG